MVAETSRAIADVARELGGSSAGARDQRDVFGELGKSIQGKARRGRSATGDI
ncbi:MAG: hypothetical protein ACRDOK_22145 [Streptosporangiaceae bacterium]